MDMFEPPTSEKSQAGIPKEEAGGKKAVATTSRSAFNQRPTPPQDQPRLATVEPVEPVPIPVPSDLPVSKGLETRPLPPIPTPTPVSTPSAPAAAKETRPLPQVPVASVTKVEIKAPEKPVETKVEPKVDPKIEANKATPQKEAEGIPASGHQEEAEMEIDLEGLTPRGDGKLVHVWIPPFLFLFFSSFFVFSFFLPILRDSDNDSRFPRCLLAHSKSPSHEGTKASDQRVHPKAA